jgi:ABC-type nitrate/sulfonate/bicarbonate transport system substrate-binding protein
MLAAPVASSAETPLRMAVVSRTVFYLPAWTAEKQGFFKAEGIDVQMKVYDTSEQIFEDLRTGAQHIAVASTESVIADAYKGGRLKIIGGNAQRPPHFIIVQPEIKSLADLKASSWASYPCTRELHSSFPISRKKQGSARRISG